MISSLFFSIEANVLICTVLVLFYSLFLKLYTNKVSPTYFLSMLLFLNVIVFNCFSPSNYVIFEDMYFSTNQNTYLIRFSFAALYILFFFISYSGGERKHFLPEYNFIYLFIFSVTNFMITVNDYLMAFILLEILGMATYVLVALAKTRYAYEASVKYLIFSSVGSLLFIFAGATAILYTKYTNFDAYPIHFIFLSNPEVQYNFPELFLALGLIVKLGVGPFFSWVADIYQAAEFTAFNFISTVGKLPLVFLLIKLAPEFGLFNQTLLLAISALSALVAAILIVYQTKLRRFFAYSSIFNYSLGITILISTNDNSDTFFRFFIYYTLATLFLYSCFNLYQQLNENNEFADIEDLRKYSNSNVSSWFGLALVATTGLPPLGLFIAKVIVLGTAVSDTTDEDLESIFHSLNITVALFLLLSSVSMFGYIKAISRIFNFDGNAYSAAETAKTNVLAPAIVLLVLLTVNIFWLYFIEF